MGKIPLTFPDNVPLGPRVDNTQPNERLGGQTHNPIPTEPAFSREERLEGQTHNPIPAEPAFSREERLGGQTHDHIPVFDHIPPRVDPKDIAQVLRVHFGMNPQTVNRPVYQRPFPERIINDHPLPRNYRPPDFYSFSGEDGASTIEHVGRFTAQLGEVGNNPFHKLQLFGLSLTRTAFSWYVSLPPGQLQTWEDLEADFHGRFFNPLPTVSLIDLLEITQMPEETGYQFIERMRLMKGRCPTMINESEMTNLVVRNMHTRLREALTAHDFQDLASLASTARRLESFFTENNHDFRQGGDAEAMLVQDRPTSRPAPFRDKWRSGPT
ncbi:uncharacterized protein LOC127263230 [Andrographis paniculata]|uniref:uncharacterized protein LOC127263230 n=1 Tax=Andrographis paniculata TaxID=175694 RepID=UPI0021E97696|nr:uncharacterized protein LOC127263230 [Andrographis paniculata]